MNSNNDNEPPSSTSEDDDETGIRKKAIAHRKIPENPRVFDIGSGLNLGNEPIRLKPKQLRSRPLRRKRCIETFMDGGQLKKKLICDEIVEQIRNNPLQTSNSSSSSYVQDFPSSKKAADSQLGEQFLAESNNKIVRKLIFSPNPNPKLNFLSPDAVNVNIESDDDNTEPSVTSRSSSSFIIQNETSDDNSVSFTELIFGNKNNTTATFSKYVQKRKSDQSSRKIIGSKLEELPFVESSVCSERNKKSLLPEKTSSVRKSDQISRKKKSNDLDELSFVESSICSTIDKKTLLPKKTFCVVEAMTEKMYKFELSVAQSTIPNAGNGAFLTYHGAHCLSESGKSKFTSLKKRGAYDISETRPEFLLLANLPPHKGKDIVVKLNGDQLHGDEQFRGSGLGILGMLNESDYDESDDHFCSYDKGCGMIDLGRYAPLLREDIISLLQFHLKEFIFSLVPNEWSFNGSDNNEVDMFDITDNITGDPHVTALAQAPIYVNEVGHNRNLKENVDIHRKKNCAIHYYFCQKSSLQKGTKIELFVNYCEQYEAVRERKGYGLKNLDGTSKDDKHFLSRICRNMKERKGTVNEVNNLSIVGIQEALTFIQVWILNNVKVGIEEYINNSMKSKKSRKKIEKESQEKFKRQFIARLRISWLSKNITRKLIMLHRYKTQDIDDNQVKIYGELKEKLSGLLWNVPTCAVKKDTFIAKVYVQELLEELLFDISGRIQEPFENSLWAKITSNLFQRMLYFLCEYYHNDWQIKEFDKSTMDSIFKILQKCCSTVHKICGDFFDLRENSQNGCKYSESQLGKIYFTPGFVAINSENQPEIKKVDMRTLNEPPSEKTYKLQCVYIFHATMSTFFERPMLDTPFFATEPSPSEMKKRYHCASNEYCDWLKMNWRYPCNYSLKKVCLKAEINIIDAEKFINQQESLRL